MQLKCPCETITVYRHDYRYPVSYNKKTICHASLCPTKEELPKKQNADATLNFGLKEYDNFEKKLKLCKTAICKLFYRQEEVKLCQLECWLREMEKIVGQVFNAPVENTALKKPIRVFKTWDPTDCNVYDAEYRYYYDRFEALLRFRGILNDRAQKWEKEQQEKAQEAPEKPMEYVVTTGSTTYYEEICRPAMELAKKKVVRVSPIDRYTSRRV